MAEGWKQIWEDIIGALRGAESKKIPASTARFDSPQRVEESGAVENVVESPTAAESAEALEPAATPVPESAPMPRRKWVDRLRTSAFFLLMTVLLLAALWFAGGYRWAPNVYLWWLRLTSPKPPAADVIATFDGGQITLGDLDAHLKLLVPEEYQSVAGSPQALLPVVEDMVTDELVKRWAATRQPDKDQTFSHVMQHINESLNLESFDLQLHKNEISISESEIQAYYESNKAEFGNLTLDQVREQIRQRLISEREQGYIEQYIQRLKDNASISRNFDLLNVPPPSEDDLRRYYEANLDQFKLPRQALVDELQFPIGSDEASVRKNADDALLKIRSGATFNEVAQTISGASALNGTLVPEGTRDPAWDAAVFGLTDGELSDIFRAGDSFYIVRLNRLQPGRTKSLEEVRADVWAVVQRQKTDEWFAANADKTLFTVKGKGYTLGQFYQEYQELPISTQSQYAGAEGMQKLAEALIERLLLVEDTYDQLLNVQNKPLSDEARLQVLKQMMHQEEVDDKIQVTDEEMQKFYDENIDLMALPPKARIRYIRISLGQTEDEQKAARARADEAYKKLVPGLFQQGADFAEVAREYSEDPETAAQGGELSEWIGESNDILAEIQLHPFHEAVLALQQNEISQPFRFGDSLYIVQVIERSAPKQLSFEQAKPYIEEILTQQKHDAQMAQLQESLLSQANFVFYPTVLEKYFQQLPTPAPLNPSP